MRSFIVTGASACGKTTLINEAIQNGYQCLPTHTTRDQRSDEINGVHNVFLNRQSFEYNFNNGLYMEPTLTYAENFGIYYGTPFNWVKYLSGEGYCAVPITPLIAEKIRNNSGVLWISLVCDNEVRRERLIARGIDEREVEARLKTINDHQLLPSYVEVFDTANLKPFDILSSIMRV